jgi:hypothetical protein
LLLELNKEQLGMPRGFGKARLELTVTETLRERLAVRTCTDPNIEVTKTASNILETIAEVGSYYSPEDKKRINNINRDLEQIYEEIDNWRINSDKYSTLFDRLHAILDRSNSSLKKCLSDCEIQKDTINYLKDELVKAKIENINLKTIQAEHCIGCPASYIQ